MIRNKWIIAKDERGIRRVRMLKERAQTYHEGRKGVKDLGGGQPRYRKKLRQKSMGNVNGTLQEDHRAGVCEASNRDVRRVAEDGELDLVEGSTPSGAEIKDWALWRGRPPPKQKKNPLATFV
jgi:hypothetical protein